MMGLRVFSPGDFSPHFHGDLNLETSRLFLVYKRLQVCAADSGVRRGACNNLSRA